MRRMRRQAEWKVDTHIFSAGGPTSSATRRRISSAALLVKVMARMPQGGGVAGRQQVGDAPGQHPGLARAGAGHDQQRAAPVLDRRPLGQGQVVDQGGGIAGEGPGLVAERRAAPAVVRPLDRERAVADSAEPQRRPLGRRHVRLGCRCSEPSSEVSKSCCVPPPLAARSRLRHSHSMVPGGFDVTSRATRFTPSTSLMTREAMRSTRS